MRSAFAEWHRVLVAGSEDVGSAMRISGTDVRFRRIARHKLKLHLDFWVGASTAAAVQLNQPGEAGSEHPGTSVAVDGRGRRFLVRQGDLHENSRSGRIRGLEFVRRTGLDPATMRVGAAAARKQWHVVTALDGQSDRAIRADTAEFIRLCWNARTFGTQAADDQRRLRSLFGPPERGAWYDVDPASLPMRVLKVQGYVSECLAKLLNGFGIELLKPRHAAGYEVDGVVDAPNGPVLIEIKTGVSAADVYGGIGQLTIYRVILPDLAGHARILLLPGRPGAELVIFPRIGGHAGLAGHALLGLLGGKIPEG